METIWVKYKMDFKGSRTPTFFCSSAMLPTSAIPKTTFHYNIAAAGFSGPRGSGQSIGRVNGNAAADYP